MLINLQTVGLQIKEARLQAGISQAELARLSDVSRVTVNGIENGTIKEIGVNRLNRVVAASRNAIKTSDTPSHPNRKSANLALSFPYDWSNPSMPDKLLIDKVVERGLFEDMAKIAARYGVHPLRQSVASFTASNPAAAPSLKRMLGNIEKAMHA
ncbi:MAG: helix-turn-helix transcriptional regulator [Gallionella sp.]